MCRQHVRQEELSSEPTTTQLHSPVLKSKEKEKTGTVHVDGWQKQKGDFHMTMGGVFESLWGCMNLYIISF